ncbi:MAG TPA: RNA polymerase sigma factor [Gaiellaceae bacterium]|nr:RNA polymerase sigma factor [Gaiellaceae bacterium]
MDGSAARLYVEYRERIYRFCYARLRSREEAEDAVQNVFMRVHMALDKGVVPEYESAWLFKIAHNVCLSRIDSNQRRGAEELHSFDEDDVQIAAPEVSGEELAGLNAALEDMPHNLRTAILLREWQGLSYAEIAAAMGLSVSAVETLIFRARRHLAWALEHPGEKRKGAVSRLLDLLGLGWLRSVLLGAGPAAKLAAGAALLALTGGGTAVALTTDAHLRPAPTVAGAPAAAPAHVVRAAAPTAAARAAKRGFDTGEVRHRPRLAVAVAPAAVVASGTKTASGAATAAAVAPTAKPSPAVTPPAKSASVATRAASTPVPTVPLPTVTVPTVTVPTVGVPTVSLPTVSVPTVSVPTVSLPVGGGLVGGK